MPVSVVVSDLPLEAALDVLLVQYDLTFVVRASGLWITTPEEAEVTLDMRVYDVSSIIGRGWNVDFDSLIEPITSSIVPTTWEEVGDHGSIHPISVHGRSLLVVSQTDEAHGEISSLMRALTGQWRGPMEDFVSGAVTSRQSRAGRAAAGGPRPCVPVSSGDELLKIGGVP
jgi:hypothetical protein